MPRQRINTGVVGSLKQYRIKFCVDCGVELEGAPNIKRCPEHAAQAAALQQAESAKRVRERLKSSAHQNSKSEAEQRMSQAALEGSAKRGSVVNSSDILHMPAEKAVRLIDRILAYRVTLVR